MAGAFAVTTNWLCRVYKINQQNKQHIFFIKFLFKMFTFNPNHDKNVTNNICECYHKIDITQFYFYNKHIEHVYDMLGMWTLTKILNFYSVTKLYKN